MSLMACAPASVTWLLLRSRYVMVLLTFNMSLMACAPASHLVAIKVKFRHGLVDFQHVTDGLCTCIGHLVAIKAKPRHGLVDFQHVTDGLCTCIGHLVATKVSFDKLGVL